MITANQVRRAAKIKVNEDNLNSVLVSLGEYGDSVGLSLPHRAVPFFAQLMHESGSFKWDREIWGPTKAQERYDVRADLGNTPARDGDGKKFMGRTTGQITGRGNYVRFRNWCRDRGYSPPDFEKYPEKLNTDPWEGLGPIWYWDAGNPDGRSLNRYADRNDQEMITRRWNGGLNGYEDRLDYYTRLGLVVLGFGPAEIRAFQLKAKSSGKYKGEVDGLDGPQTRAAIHLSLSAMQDDVPEVPTVDVKASPVVEEKAVAVVPPSLDAPWWQSKEVLVPAAGGGIATTVSAFGSIPWQNLVIILGFVALGGAFLYWRKRADAAKVETVVKEIGT